jgi:hypothetical protein
MFRRKKKFFYVMTIESPSVNRKGTISAWIKWQESSEELYKYLFEDACKHIGTDPKYTYTMFWTVIPFKF